MWFNDIDLHLSHDPLLRQPRGVAPLRHEVLRRRLLEERRLRQGGRMPPSV